MAEPVTLPLRELFLLLQYATQHLTVPAQCEILYAMAIALQDHMDLPDATLKEAGFPSSSGEDGYYDSDAESSD